MLCRSPPFFCLFSAAAGAFEGKAHTGPAAATLQHGRRASNNCHLAMFVAPHILGCFAPIEVAGVRVGLYATTEALPWQATGFMSTMIVVVGFMLACVAPHEAFGMQQDAG